jgi:hypothetical protein
MKPKLAEAVALPLSVVSMMNVVAMKATTIATKEDRKEQLDIEEEDDRVEGEDDEDVDMDSPRYKKPRREEVEQKKREHEINERMDTHSEEEPEEPLESFLFNPLPPEVQSFLRLLRLHLLLQHWLLTWVDHLRSWWCASSTTYRSGTWLGPHRPAPSGTHLPKRTRSGAPSSTYVVLLLRLLRQCWP